MNNIDVELEKARDYLFDPRNKTYTLHFWNRVKGSEEGYVEVAFCTEQETLRTWKNYFEEMDFPIVTLEFVVEALKGLVGSISSEFLNPKFKELLGPNAVGRVVRNTGFAFISDDKVSLIFHSKDWSSVDQYYGQYVRPTQH